MKLFLQGDARIGKSTLLRDALRPCEKDVAGLMVQRLFEKGAACGFRVCAVRGSLPPLEDGYSKGQDGIFLYRGQAFPGVLAAAAAKALRLCATPGCGLVLLDEIGGMELLSDVFMRSLRALLALGKPCLGVLKSHGNLMRTSAGLGLPAEVFQLREALQKTIEADGAVLSLTEENRNETARAVERFLSAAQAAAASPFKEELPSSPANSSSLSS
jgi:nucleoside-triphosphatase THEP1